MKIATLRVHPNSEYAFLCLTVGRTPQLPRRTSSPCSLLHQMPLEPRLEGIYRRQVGAAAAADQRRQLEDTTKKRAIVSAANYGEFKALVDACHLRPLGREEMHRQTQRFLNPYAAPVFQLPSATPGNNSISSSSATSPQLNSQIQLRRQWEARSDDPDGQCRYTVSSFVAASIRRLSPPLLPIKMQR